MKNFEISTYSHISLIAILYLCLKYGDIKAAEQCSGLNLTLFWPEFAKHLATSFLPCGSLPENFDNLIIRLYVIVI